MRIGATLEIVMCDPLWIGWPALSTWTGRFYFALAHHRPGSIGNLTANWPRSVNPGADDEAPTVTKSLGEESQQEDRLMPSSLDRLASIINAAPGFPVRIVGCTALLTAGLGLASPAALGAETTLGAIAANQDLSDRGDIRNLPDPLKRRLNRLAARPHTFSPMRAFAEADTPSQLFAYYLLDTSGFQPNVFTAAIPGINDHAIPTAANAANGQLPTIGAVRLVLEPKPGLPTDPEDVGGVHRHLHRHLGSLRHQQRVRLVRRLDDPRPGRAASRAAAADGHAQFGTMTSADAAAIAAMGDSPQHARQALYDRRQRHPLAERRGSFPGISRPTSCRYR